MFTKQGLTRIERHFVKFKSLLSVSAYIDVHPLDEATVWGICQVGLIPPCNSDIYFVRRGSSPRYTLTRSQICRPPWVHLDNQCLHDSAADSSCILDLINMYLVYLYAKLAFTCLPYPSFFA